MIKVQLAHGTMQAGQAGTNQTGRERTRESMVIWARLMVQRWWGRRDLCNQVPGRGVRTGYSTQLPTPPMPMLPPPSFSWIAPESHPCQSMVLHYCPFVQGDAMPDRCVANHKKRRRKRRVARQCAPPPLPPPCLFPLGPTWCRPASRLAIGARVACEPSSSSSRSFFLFFQPSTPRGS